LEVIPFGRFKEQSEKTDRDSRLDAVAGGQTATGKQIRSLPKWLTRGCECCFAEDQRQVRHQEKRSDNGQSTNEKFKPP
jgi:hypothetical protein